MKVKFLIQYPDKNQSDFVDMGFVDMNEAIKAYNDFPWEEQIKIEEERDTENLSSSRTCVIFKNIENDESMIIYGFDKVNAEIYFQKGNKLSTIPINGDITKNPEVIDVTDYIIAFFQNNLDLNYTHEEYEDGEIIQLGHSKLKMELLNRSWILLIPILFAIIKDEMNSSKNRGSILWFFLFSYGFFFIFALPFILLLFHYFFKPQINSASFNSDNSALILNFKNQKTIIKRNEILQIVHTYCSNDRNLSSLLSNISLTLKDKRQFFLTTLNFNEDELSLILRKLNVNYYSFDKLLPLVHTRLLNNEYKLDPKDYAVKSELEKLYKDYPDEMLNDILKNKKGYQPDAVKAAREEIELRKKKN